MANINVLFLRKFPMKVEEKAIIGLHSLYIQQRKCYMLSFFKKKKVAHSIQVHTSTLGIIKLQSPHWEYQ